LKDQFGTLVVPPFPVEAAERLARRAHDEKVEASALQIFFQYFPGVYGSYVFLQETNVRVIRPVRGACDGIVVDRGDYPVAFPFQAGRYPATAAVEVHGLRNSALLTVSIVTVLRCFLGYTFRSWFESFAVLDSVADFRCRFPEQFSDGLGNVPSKNPPDPFWGGFPQETSSPGSGSGPFFRPRRHGPFLLRLFGLVFGVSPNAPI
jgi:hypothetical protein